MNPIPPGYEEVPAPFLREHGAVEGMMWRTKGVKLIECWTTFADDLLPGEEFEIHIAEDYDFIAPIGTMARLTPPAPTGDEELREDCPKCHSHDVEWEEHRCCEHERFICHKCGYKSAWTEVPQ